MGFGLKFALAIIAVVCFLASPTLAQLNQEKSWFLFSGQSPGKITLVSLTGVNNNITLPAHSESITVQSLTDTVNGRFLILSGISEADGTTLYTFSNISVASQAISTVNSFSVPPTMTLKDVTYDTTMKLPVSLLINATGECFIMVGYGPANTTQALTLTQLQACNNVSTIGSLLASNLIVTVANLNLNGVQTAEVCRGQPGLRMSCDRAAGTVYSNLIGSTSQLGVFPAVYTRLATNDNFVGVLNQLDVATALGRLTAGNVSSNEHIPIYWDPMYSVVAGAWKTTGKQIQVFAATYPYQGWYSPATFALPQGELIGFSLAYKPVAAPITRPTMPVQPVKAPASKTGIIVGAVIGGVAAFAFFVGIALFIRNSFSFQYRKLPNE